MKKYLTMSLIAAAAILAGCDKDSGKDSPKDPQGLEGDGYIGVTLTMGGGAGQTGTKAWNDAMQEGTAEEVQVDEALFLFYDNTGAAINVAAEATTNVVRLPGEALVWSATDHTHQYGTAVSDDLRSTAVIVLNASAIDSGVSQMLVLLNQDANSGNDIYTAVKDKALSEVLTVIETGNDLANATAGRFVMSNSVYVKDDVVDGTGTVVSTQALDASYIKKSAVEAEAAPIVVHVERVLAGIQVSGATTGKVLKAKGSSEQITLQGGIPVGYEVIGWWADNTYSKANLVKNLSNAYSWTVAGATVASWPTSGLDWTSATNYRSFWENVPAGGTLSHNSLKDNQNVSASRRVYVYPNTPAKSVLDSSEPEEAAVESAATQIVVAVKFFADADNDGAKGSGEDYIDFVRYQGSYYTIDDFKKVLAKDSRVIKFLVNDADGYHTIGGKSTMTDAQKLAEVNEYLDISYVTCQTTHNGSVTNPDYTSGTDYGDRANLEDWEGIFTIKLKAGKTVYLRDGAVYTAYDGNTSADELLITTAVPYWKEATAYYYLPIKHNDSLDENTLGYYGVVRNHLYNVNINSIAGFGTPIPAGEEFEVVPEKVVDDQSFLACSIYILKWKLVTANYDFD